jgi:hypothetical protein
VSIPGNACYDSNASAILLEVLIMGKTLIPKTRKAAKPRFAPGQPAMADFGAGQIPVIIIEDRGNIGSQGRHLVFVRSNSPNTESDTTFEISADSLILSKPTK